MSRRGVQLALVAVLGLVLSTTAGFDTAPAINETRGTSATSTAPGAAQLLVHLGGSTVLGDAVLVPARHDRSASAARAQRLVAIVAVLLGGALALRSRSPTRHRHHGLPVWSGWFADPGRLRGPPAV